MTSACWRSLGSSNDTLGSAKQGACACSVERSTVRARHMDRGHRASEVRSSQLGSPRVLLIEGGGHAERESPGTWCRIQCDRRADSRRAGEDDGRREQRHDPRRADLHCRPSDSRVDSRRRDGWDSEPRRDQHCGAAVGPAKLRKTIGLHSECTRRGQARAPPIHEQQPWHWRPALCSPDSVEQIVGARNYEDILAIVEAESSMP